MVIPKIVNTFALNLNIITMNDLNRLKVVLVEQKKTGNLVLALQPQADGAQMHHSQTFKH